MGTFILCQGRAQDNTSISEYLLKSIQLYRICLFTHWPDTEAQGAYFHIGILGESQQSGQIDIPIDKKIHYKNVVLMKIEKVTRLKDVEVLFIHESEKNRLPEILQSIQDKPILTVGDSPGFSEDGVMVNFYVKEGQVLFELNRRQIRESPLKVDPQLFSIGRVTEWDISQISDNTFSD